jgi:hypothetical protein
MEDISEGAEQNEDHSTFIGTLPLITEVGTEKPQQGDESEEEVEVVVKEEPIVEDLTDIADYT